MADHFDVAIIGGGLIGTSAAIALRKRGLTTVVVERDRCGAHSSGINYGGVRRQGRPAAQLPMSQHAHHVWVDLKKHVGTDGEFLPSGHLKLARTEADLAALEAYKHSVESFGLELEILNSNSLKQRCPWVGDGIIGGSLCHGDGHANPRLVAPAFARAAGAAGAAILEGQSVETLEQTEQGFQLLCGEHRIRAGQVIIAAGAWAGKLSSQFGETPPINVEHPTMLVTESLSPIVHESIGMQGGGFYARQAVRGNFVIGGGRGHAINAVHSRPGLAGIEPVMRRAMEVFPFLGHARILRTWSGTEAMTPDHNPIIGPSRTTQGLFYAFGFSGGGFQLAPAVGDLLAELIDTGQTSFDLAPFAIDRFESKQVFVTSETTEDI